MAIADPGAPFKFVGGRLCLDFVNTVSGRLPASLRASEGHAAADVVEKERLVTYDDLVRWGLAADILTRAEAEGLTRRGLAQPVKAAHVVTRARVLREALYRVFVASIEGRNLERADCDVLNRELGRTREHERLAAGPRGLTWTWSVAEDELDRVLWPAVRSAADVLTSGDLRRIHRCRGEDCRWLFLDNSRNHSRRWCDMADCGNRAKVRRFRRRR